MVDSQHVTMCPTSLQIKQTGALVCSPAGHYTALTVEEVKVRSSGLGIGRMRSTREPKVRKLNSQQLRDHSHPVLSRNRI